MATLPVSVAISQSAAGATGGDEIIAAPGAGSRLVVLGYALAADAAGTAKWHEGTNEVWTITIDATGGTFTATYGGQTTAATAYNASAATLQTNLEALSNVEVGDMVVTKSGSVFTITTAALLGGQNLTAPTTDAGSLTGGASTATVATATQGASSDLTGAVDYPQRSLASVGFGGMPVMRLSENTSLRLATVTSKMRGHVMHHTETV